MKSEDGELRIHYEKAETECMETVVREEGRIRVLHECMEE